MFGRKLYAGGFRFEFNTDPLLFERKYNNNNKNKKNQSNETGSLMRLYPKIPIGTVTAQE